MRHRRLTIGLPIMLWAFYGALSLVTPLWKSLLLPLLMAHITFFLVVLALIVSHPRFSAHISDMWVLPLSFIMLFILAFIPGFKMQWIWNPMDQITDLVAFKATGVMLCFGSSICFFWMYIEDFPALKDKTSYFLGAGSITVLAVALIELISRA